jgi:RNA polymerase sigma-70 factor (ECF subfamily)
VNRFSGDSLPSDAELVARTLRGDDHAFGALVGRYEDRVFNMVYRMCRNHADALDVTQTAFIRAHAALARFEAKANFFTWLYRIAVNAAITHKRHAASRPRLVPTVTGDDEGQRPALEPAATIDPSSDLRRHDLSDRIASALARVEPEFRAAVILKDIEELDYSAIAEILHVPVGTVKSRIFRGRALLREMLLEFQDGAP